MVAAITSDTPAVVVRSVEPGFLTVTADRPVHRRLRALPYLSSCLLVLAARPWRGLDQTCCDLARALERVPQRLPPLPGRSFRLRVSVCGQLVSIDKAAHRQLVTAFQGWSGLPADPRHAEVELWAIQRRGDNQVQLALRLDTGRLSRLPPGALRPDVAAAFVRVVDPYPSERVFDPFAGSGAVSAARARYRLASNLLAERDGQLVAGLRRRQARGELGQGARILRLDVLDLDRLAVAVPAGSVDTVITDPPWGFFQRRDEREDRAFYSALWRTVDHCLARHGRAVLLLSNPSPALALLPSGLKSTRDLPVLVNGKKAQVLVVERNPSP